MFLGGAHSKRTEGNVHKLQYVKFQLDTRKNICSVGGQTFE